SALSNNSTSAPVQALRTGVFNRVVSPGLTNFVLPDFLHIYLEQWRDGHFDNDWNLPAPPAPPVPDQLDRAALEACIGANFFPGIEGTINLRDKEMYAAPFRFDPARTTKVYPGWVTEPMAVPWQADFFDCSGGSWWPSQRPDIAMLKA